MFYDERWIEKQERAFTWWLNYVLTPDDFKVNTESTKGKLVFVEMSLFFFFFCKDESVAFHFWVGNLTFVTRLPL